MTIVDSFQEKRRLKTYNPCHEFEMLYPDTDENKK